MADYFKKHHPIYNHRKMHPTILKPTQKDLANSKDRQNGTGRGCYGTSIPRVTQKLDNPLKGIRNISPNRTWNQWLCGLAMPT